MKPGVYLFLISSLLVSICVSKISLQPVKVRHLLIYSLHGEYSETVYRNYKPLKVKGRQSIYRTSTAACPSRKREKTLNIMRKLSENQKFYSKLTQNQIQSLTLLEHRNHYRWSSVERIHQRLKKLAPT